MGESMLLSIILTGVQYHLHNCFGINRSVQEMLLSSVHMCTRCSLKLAQNVLFSSQDLYSSIFLFSTAKFIFSELGVSFVSLVTEPLATVIFNHRFFNVKLVGEYGDTLTGGLKGQCQDNADPTAWCGQISAGQTLPYK